MAYSKIDTLSINTIRLLAVDATAKSNSGHPGAPMGMAPAAHVLWNRIMKFNPKNPNWLNRDRFVLSNGHGCLLQYVVLHLLGYNLSMNDLKQFRQLDSNTPGHPENTHTPGVEITTGPLGQGIATAVGLAIGQQHTAANFNRPEFDLINNYTYVFLGDGCLQEGVSSEACSLAGHLQLGNLIAVYDDNQITIDGKTNLAFTEDVVKRYQSYGWHTITVEDGDNDLKAIEEAIVEAKKVTDKPTIIKLKTTIGYGSKLEGSAKVHGSPLQAEDIAQIKTKWGFDSAQSFVVPDEVYEMYHQSSARGAAIEQEWNMLLEKYDKAYPDLSAELKRRVNKELPQGWEKHLPVYKPSDKPEASRKLSEAVIQSIQNILPEFVSGSADLTGSNNTIWKGAVDFQAPATGLGDWTGRYFRYGVREHAMSALMTGMAAYGTIIPAGGTFLNFVSYAVGAVRLSALSRFQTILVATHDSIGLGEDGPTHQPIETLNHLRSIPNLMVWRPADGNETSAAYKLALTRRQTPSVLALTRQNLKQLETSTIEKAEKGGYVVVEREDAKVALVATGSEVNICVDAAKILEAQGTATRVISLPCTLVFDEQPEEYRLSVFQAVPTMSVEVMTTHGWARYSHEQFGLDRFGLSAPYMDIYKKFEFTPEGVADRALKTVEAWKGMTVKSPISRAFSQVQ